MGQTRAPLVGNGDFENGDLSNWTVGTHYNPGLSAVPPTSLSDLSLLGTGAHLTFAVNGAPETQIPVGLSAGSTLRYPRYGQWAAVVNQNGSSNNTNSLSQTFRITNSDIDPADGKFHLRFALAPVFEDPGHLARDQPYFYVVVHNTTRNKQLFSKFEYSNQPGVPWKTDPSSQVLYTDWKIFDFAPNAADIDVGDQLELTVVAAGCSQGGHFGHVYVDGFGAFLPGLSISASAPSQANAGDALTYTYLVSNSGPDTATHVIVDQPLPANTTFVGLNAPGAVCTVPAVGAQGTVSCDLGTLNPAASTTFQLTVRIDPGATGTVSNGNYTVRDDRTSALLGPLVETLITQGMVFADLAITKSDGVAAAGWGQTLQYLIEVTNHGPAAVNDAHVMDTLPAQLTSATWTCTASHGGVCATPTGTDDIDAKVHLPVNGKAIFSLSATVVSGSGTGRLSNLASVTVPEGVIDNDSTNNQGVDTDSIGNLHLLTVSKDPASSGTGLVVTSPAAISCDAACARATAQFLEGTLVSVTATAAPGDTFVGWTGACTGSANPCDVTITADTVLTALFTSPRAPTGSTCSSATNCLSGSCVDGVCCNTSCTEQCMACNVPGSVGTCSPVTGAPVGDRPACAAGDSVCGGSCDGTGASCSHPTSNIVVRQPTTGACCLNVDLNDYNLFLREDYSGGHDVVGKVAAGGNITLTNFSVGWGLPGNDISNTLVAGGLLTLSRGGVWGDARYAGGYSTNQSVVFPRGHAAQGAPIDFATRFDELRDLSSRLDRIPANGSTSRESWGGLMLNGTHPVLNVFDMSASAFTRATLFELHAPAGSFVVVNVRGASATLSRFAMLFSGGIDLHRVLFNFVDATSIDASSIGIQGTVLAPNARVTFNDGAWDGGIYALSLTGDAEGHINPLQDHQLCP
ncbi:choice-of-anchor A family protein [Cystobacter fuscus]|uniref:choice-of-anchor A family protein n=1 Tax=Cystobacter fuscus TaxID=43 RepID=UPI001FDF8C6B|nr:choice-of-anchor A family protein [Cystobacter fuscus]